jgi:hypothetical protein
MPVEPGMKSLVLAYEWGTSLTIVGPGEALDKVVGKKTLVSRERLTAVDGMSGAPLFRIRSSGSGDGLPYEIAVEGILHGRHARGEAVRLRIPAENGSGCVAPLVCCIDVKTCGCEEDDLCSNGARVTAAGAWQEVQQAASGSRSSN